MIPARSSRRAFTHDVIIIIIGQGLAGTALNESLADAGARVMMFDMPLPNKSSAEAANWHNVFRKRPRT